MLNMKIMVQSFQVSHASSLNLTHFEQHNYNSRPIVTNIKDIWLKQWYKCPAFDNITSTRIIKI